MTTPVYTERPLHSALAGGVLHKQFGTFAPAVGAAGPCHHDGGGKTVKS